MKESGGKFFLKVKVLHSRRHVDTLVQQWALGHGKKGTEWPSLGLPEREVLPFLYKNLKQRLFLPLLSLMVCFPI